MSNSYVLWFVVALAASMMLTPLLGRLASATGIIDRPSRRKFHFNSTPLFGGVAIAVATVVVVIFSFKGELNRQHIAVLSVSIVMMIVGLVDDVKTVSPRTRIIIQALVTVILSLNGLHATLTGIAVVDYFLTFIWVVGIMNCINLMDNMDGLAGGTAAIASCFFFVVAIVTGKPMAAMTAVVFSGACLGFLFHNFHPATIFAGDAGSMFMGMILAAMGLFVMEPGNLISHMVPPVILGTVIFDTGLVTVMRLKHGHRITDGGKDHTSHRLCNLGLSIPVSVSILFLCSLIFGFSALVQLWMKPALALVFSLALVCVMVLCGYLLRNSYDYKHHSKRDSGGGDGLAEPGVSPAAAIDRQ